MFLAGLSALGVAAIALNHDITSLKVKEKKLGSYFLRPETQKVRQRMTLSRQFVKRSCLTANITETSPKTEDSESLGQKRPPEINK